MVQKLTLQKLPLSAGFERAFNAFQQRTYTKSKPKSEIGSRGKSSKQFLAAMMKPTPPPHVYSSKYQAARVLLHNSLEENSTLHQILEPRPQSKNPNPQPSRYSITAENLEKLEAATREPLHMVSYMDWAVAASQYTATKLQNFAETISNGDLSDEAMELLGLSNDLVTLTRFQGRIVNDLIPTLTHVAGTVTNMRRDRILAHVQSALSQEQAVGLRASNYMGPSLFDPVSVESATEQVQKTLTEESQATMLESVKEMANANTKRTNQGQPNFQPQKPRKRPRSSRQSSHTQGSQPSHSAPSSFRGRGQNRHHGNRSSSRGKAFGKGRGFQPRT
jgi:hypothetical protein